LSADRSDGHKRLEARYANYLRVGFSAHEFILDFGQYYPDDTSEEIHTRISVTPHYLGVFASVIGKALRQYGKEHPSGPVRVIPESPEQE
jgi:hypothetical protein